MKTNKILTILAVATLPFLASCASEAERARITAEKEEKARIEKIERERLEKERREAARREAKKALNIQEKQSIRARFQEEIFPAEQKLSEEERSRGRALLDAFGEEQMPTLAERCKEARSVFLEAEANLKELAKSLQSENIDLETNDIFQAAGNRWLDLATEYWYLRYKLTDFYSQFKIGAITPDELATKDSEFAKE